MPHLGRSSAPQPPLAIPPIDVLPPVPSAVPVAVLVSSAATSSAHSGSSSPLATSSFQSHERLWSHCSPEPHPVPMQSQWVPAASGFRSGFRAQSPTWFHFRALSSTQSCSQASSSTRSASSVCSGSTQSSFEQLQASSCCFLSLRWSWDNSSSRSRARSPARTSASSLSVIYPALESRSPLDSVAASYSARTSFLVQVLFPLIPISCC